MPTLGHLNATALREISPKDYVATYEPRARKVTKLNILGLADTRGLNLHGMDVVPDERDSGLLWMYLVNHRPPLDPTANAAETGADSVIEIFKTRLGSDSIEWVETMSDPKFIITPNDILGGPSGKEFWFTNDHAAKTGMIAADKLYSSNGIIRIHDLTALPLQDKSGKIWVGSSVGGYITIHTQRADKTLAPMEVVKIGRAIDNLALAQDGSVIAAAFPRAAHFTGKAVKDANLPSPASAVRIFENAGKGYKVEKIYESDGIMSGSASTTASMYQDNLYIHGAHHPLRPCVRQFTVVPSRSPGPSNACLQNPDKSG
ncbi:hypothetical protein FRC10_002177 [Ceratobasidium sp. 414]|nr:hypothetical protein FRC10_002177 [Ceratobasidium sp. 414]